MSPNNKKLLQQLVKTQFGANSKGVPHQQPQSAGLPFSISGQSNSLVQDYSSSQDQNTKRGSAHKALISAGIMPSSAKNHQASSSSKDNKTPNKGYPAGSNTQRKDSGGPSATHGGNQHHIGKGNDHSLELSPITGGDERLRNHIKQQPNNK